jgi:hypothetical protein
MQCAPSWVTLCILKCESGAPETIRTSDHCLRRAVLYPAELRARGADFRTEPSMVWRPLGIHASPLSLVRYALQRISRALAPTPAELRARGADFRTEPSAVWQFAGSAGQVFGLYTAACKHAAKCPIQPPVVKVISQIRPVNTNQNSAHSQRPCTNWPKPGIKKLHTAAMTLPVDPWPTFAFIDFSRSATAIARLANTMRSISGAFKPVESHAYPLIFRYE